MSLREDEFGVQFIRALDEAVADFAKGSLREKFITAPSPMGAILDPKFTRAAVNRSPIRAMPDVEAPAAADAPAADAPAADDVADDDVATHPAQVNLDSRVRIAGLSRDVS